MIFHLLILIFSFIITLLSFIFLVVGLIKKRKPLWISSLIGVVVFILLTVFFAFRYIDKSIDYMGSEEFQENTRKKAENVGKSWGNTVSGTAKGLEETLDEESIDKLAHKTAQIIGSGVKAVTAGLDETIGKSIIYKDKSLENTGIEIGRAEPFRDTDTGKYGYKLLLEFKTGFKDALLLASYDSEGLKQEVSSMNLEGLEGESKVFIFLFDYLDPKLSDYCILSKK